MPYTLKKYPPQLKNLPQGARKIWIETFNKVEKETDDEDQARKAAWRNVKLKYKKQGDKWVRKTTESHKLYISNSTTFVRLAEGEENKGKAVFRVIKPGWSENGFYYPKDVTPQLVELIKQKPMFFNRHLEPKEKKDKVFGHQLPDSVAIAEEVWADDNGEVFALLNPLEGPNRWIYDTAIRYPGIVGNSIDAYGKIKKGEAEGKKGNIVEAFVGYNSTDFVYRPAAGGKFISLTESERIEEFSMEDFEVFLEAVSSSFKEYLDKMKDRNEFWIIGDALISFVYNLFSWNDEMTDEEKQKVFEDALSHFVDELKRLNPKELFGGNFKDELNQLEQKLGGTYMFTQEVIEALKKASPEAIKASFPELYSQLKESIIGEEQLKTKVGKVADLEKERDELLEKVSVLSKEKETLSESVKQLEDELNQLKAKLTEAEWKDKVEKMLEESGIKPELITEKFKETLFKLRDETVVQEMINDRKEFQEKVSTNLDNGKQKSNNNNNNNNSPVIDDDQLVAAIKSY